MTCEDVPRSRGNRRWFSETLVLTVFSYWIEVVVQNSAKPLDSVVKQKSSEIRECQIKPDLRLLLTAKSNPLWDFSERISIRLGLPNQTRCRTIWTNLNPILTVTHQFETLFSPGVRQRVPGSQHPRPFPTIPQLDYNLVTPLSAPGKLQCSFPGAARGGTRISLVIPPSPPRENEKYNLVCNTRRIGGGWLESIWSPPLSAQVNWKYNLACYILVSQTGRVDRGITKWVWSLLTRTLKWKYEIRFWVTIHPIWIGLVWTFGESRQSSRPVCAIGHRI